MAVADIEVRTDRGDVEVDLARCVSAVHDRENGCRTRPRAELLDRKTERGRRRDVTHEQRARPRRERSQQVVDRGSGQRVDLDEARSARLAHASPEQLVAAVLVRRGDDLVAGLKVERVRGRVYRRRRVRDEDQVGGRSAHERGEPLTRVADQGRKAAFQAQEFDRRPLELALEPLVLVEHRPRTRAEGAVVEEHDVRIEQKELTH